MAGLVDEVMGASSSGVAARVLGELGWVAERARAPLRRPMGVWAEETLFLPGGPFKGRPFRMGYQPFSRCLFQAFDAAQGFDISYGVGFAREDDTGRLDGGFLAAARHWREFAVTGPTQTGKTYLTWVVWILYHVFEWEERTIAGIPDMNMAGDKWRDDLVPPIRYSAYRDQLPVKGAGSRGAGKVESVQFRNGAVLKFMGGGGGAAARSGFEARVLCVTEADKLDKVDEVSKEGNKLSQFEARTDSHGARAVKAKECTLSDPDGHLWTRYLAGTRGVPVVCCVHCGTWVRPELAHLQGWQDAESAVAARARAHFCCPGCGKGWTEDQRRAMCGGCRLGFCGVPEDVTEAPALAEDPFAVPMDTEIFSFRWNSFDNLFKTAGDLGAAEWAAAREVDEDAADITRRQFRWALPAKPSVLDLSRLSAGAVMDRWRPGTKRGVVPADRDDCVVAVLDVGLHVCWFGVLAFGADDSGDVIEYGELGVSSRNLGMERGLWEALEIFKGWCDRGWPGHLEGGGMVTPDGVVIDSGGTDGRDRAWASVVYRFCAEAGWGWWPYKGYGEGQRTGIYTAPKRRGKIVRAVGDEWHLARLRDAGVELVEANADKWKTDVHDGLTVPLGEPGALALHAPAERDPRRRRFAHADFAKQVTAERKVTEFVQDKGMVTKWVVERAKNHYLDVCAMGYVGRAVVEALGSMRAGSGGASGAVRDLAELV